MKIIIHTSGNMRPDKNPQINILLASISFCLIICFLPTVFSVIHSDEDEGATKSFNYTTLDRLRLQLFMNYDKKATPTTLGLPSNITLGLSIHYIDIDEMDGKITLHGFLKATWMDESRSWNSKDFDNIKEIHLQPNSLWTPDITVFNSAVESDKNYMSEVGLLLYQDGTVLWVPKVLYNAYCSLNLLKWPYDEQVCRFKVGCWSQTYITEKSVIDLSDYLETTEWQIKNASAKFITKEYYNYIEYEVSLKRRSSMYTAVIYTPAACIILLSLSIFWLPPQMGEKIMLNAVIIVVVSAFLMYFAQLLPILATNTPLIVLFYSSTLMLLSISTIISVIVLYLSTAVHKRRLPEFIRVLLNGSLGNVLLLKDFALESEPSSLSNYNGSKELSEHVYDCPDNESMADPLSININPNPVSRSVQFDWILLATAVDRIFFVLYCLVFIVFAILYEV